jgi:hypothetical protein
VLLHWDRDRVLIKQRRWQTPGGQVLVLGCSRTHALLRRMVREALSDRSRARDNARRTLPALPSVVAPSGIPLHRSRTKQGAANIPALELQEFFAKCRRAGSASVMVSISARTFTVGVDRPPQSASSRKCGLCSKCPSNCAENDDAGSAVDRSIGPRARSPRARLPFGIGGSQSPRRNRQTR